MNYRYMHPRDELVLTMERIYSYKMTTTSGGNLSILDENGDIWITPARVDKGALAPEDIVRVKPDATVVGRHPPSSELPFHQAIYRIRPDIKSVVHAHPMALVAFSIAHRTPETRVIPQAWQIEGKVGFAPYGVPGSEDLGHKIALEFGAGFDSVILENHGVCCGGKDLRPPPTRFRGVPKQLRPPQLERDHRHCLRPVPSAARLGLRPAGSASQDHSSGAHHGWYCLEPGR